MKEPFAQLREEYREGPLHDHHLLDDPISQFREWFKLAVEREPSEANAMALATSDGDGRPSARVVLLKELDTHGFVFFTNYESRKGRELTENPQAALVFYWPSQHRQVRVEGRIEKVSAAESDAYFESRPQGARIGAWASRQSEPVADRAELERRRDEQEQRFENEPLHRPPHWGGFRLLPELLEFWQGRPDRLHDRLVYQRQGASWQRQRLMP